MAGNIETSRERNGFSWRLVGWAIPLSILLLPLIAHLPWTLSDFIVMGVLLGSVGLLIELAVRASPNGWYRAGAGLAVAAAFLLIWVNLAVGFLGSENNPANLMFLAVLAVAAVGGVVGGFRPAGMGRAMLAAAAAQVLVGAIGLAAGLASPGNDGIYEVVMGTGLFTSLWLASAWLFRKAA
jgi:hypothetical protein